MKKYIIGIAVGLVFIVYSFALRHKHSGLVIAPPSTSNGSSSQNSSGTNPGVKYRDGTYNGSIANAFYGNVQVQVVISNGKITTVNFIQSPSDNANSLYINQTADPYLKQEALQAQSYNVSTITGATLTSEAFSQSLSAALSQATQN